MPTRDIMQRIKKNVLKGEEERYGLVISIDEHHDNRLNNLSCAGNDAKAIYNIMTNADYGLFKEDNIELLLNSDATKKAILRAFSKFSRKVSNYDTFWLYYAGHTACGDEEGEYF